MKYGCAPRFNFDDDLTIIAKCKVMNNTPAAYLNVLEKIVGYGAGTNEAARRQRIYRECVLKETAPLLSEAVTS